MLKARFKGSLLTWTFSLRESPVSDSEAGLGICVLLPAKNLVLCRKPPKKCKINISPKNITNNSQFEQNIFQLLACYFFHLPPNLAFFSNKKLGPQRNKKTPQKNGPKLMGLAEDQNPQDSQRSGVLFLLKQAILLAICIYIHTFIYIYIHNIIDEHRNGITKVESFLWRIFGFFWGGYVNSFTNLEAKST